jgi:uncharacterized membrane protein (UPF0127 family)
MRAAVLAVLIGLTAAACTSEAGAPIEPDGSVRFSGSDRVLHVRVADTDDERRRGLMGVDSLGPDRGMLFVFGEPTTGGFWMKDTLIPLSIAFVADGDIVAIEEMTPCTAEPCPTWDAGGAPYTMAIEANEGWFGRHGVDGSVSSVEEYNFTVGG